MGRHFLSEGELPELLQDILVKFAVNLDLSDKLLNLFDFFRISIKAFKLRSQSVFFLDRGLSFLGRLLLLSRLCLLRNAWLSLSGLGCLLHSFRL